MIAFVIGVAVVAASLVVASAELTEEWSAFRRLARIRRHRPELDQRQLAMLDRALLLAWHRHLLWFAILAGGTLTAAAAILATHR